MDNILIIYYQYIINILLHRLNNNIIFNYNLMELLDLLTIGIKTFNRPACLDNCLAHIRHLYPTINIIVGDDSNDQIKQINKTITDKYNVTLIDIPFDSGVSIGRNTIIENTTTKYYLTLDDDNYIDKGTKIIDILQFMEAKPEIDLVGGVCPDRKHMYKQDVSIYSYTFINIHDLDILCCHNFIKLSDRMDIYKTNIVLQLFIAKTDVLQKHKWNPDHKFEEHKPFFVELYKNNITCAVSYEFIFKEITDNRRQYIESDSPYNKVNHNMLYDLKIIDGKILDQLGANVPSSDDIISNININKNKCYERCLIDMKIILDSNNQSFFLAAGTLLGQYRNNDFISYDGDIDIGILNSDFNENLQNIILDSDMFMIENILGKKEESLEYCLRHRNGVKIDIQIYYPIPEEVDYYYMSTYYGLCDSKPCGCCKWGRHIRGLKEITFKNNTFNIPNNTEEFLIESYGDDWNVPKKYTYWEGLDGEYKNMLN